MDCFHEQRLEVKPLAVSAQTVIAEQETWLELRPLEGAVAATPLPLDNRVDQLGGEFGMPTREEVDNGVIFAIVSDEEKEIEVWEVGK